MTTKKFKEVDVVREGKFHIYPISTNDEGLELLTGSRSRGKQWCRGLPGEHRQPYYSGQAQRAGRKSSEFHQKLEPF